LLSVFIASLDDVRSEIAALKQSGGTDMVSEKEWERRHRATRAAMDRAGIDVLVAISDAHHKGDVYYLTNHTIWSQRGYVVMTQEAGPILAVAMASQDYWARKDSWATEVKWSAAPVREVVATRGV
jgi:hypothetical protein